MKRFAIYAVAAATALTGTVLLGTGAQATTQHCDSSLYPNKVELDNGGTSVDTGLAPGTEVCIKAGTRTVIVTVDGNGYITQGTIKNRPGNAFLGISYYAYGEEQCETDSNGDCEYPS
jgi:hypothetical protein